jgi:hypothetical protein
MDQGRQHSMARVPRSCLLVVPDALERGEYSRELPTDDWRPSPAPKTSVTLMAWAPKRAPPRRSALRSHRIADSLSPTRATTLYAGFPRTGLLPPSLAEPVCQVRPTAPATTRVSKNQKVLLSTTTASSRSEVRSWPTEAGRILPSPAIPLQGAQRRMLQRFDSPTTGTKERSGPDDGGRQRPP